MREGEGKGGNRKGGEGEGKEGGKGEGRGRRKGEGPLTQIPGSAPVLYRFRNIARRWSKVIMECE